MKSIKTLLLAASLLTASATSGLALAHTDKPHDRKAGPVKKEQKDWGIAGDAKAVKRTVEFRTSWKSGKTRRLSSCSGTTAR